jgi:molybdate transport system substrate-binding protein
VRTAFRRAAVALAIAASAAALAACGGGGGGPKLTVFAASSLQDSLTTYGESFAGARVRGSFAGSDQLAAQIRQGARPDVFASADTSYPAQLRREGLVEKPRVFASNRLVLAVPSDGAVTSLADLAKPGTKLVIGDPSVPVGAYTREVLARLPAGERRAILGNVRSQEPEVTSVLAKLLNGAADAGFVYTTDVKSAPPGSLRTIALPRRLQPDVAYAAAVVKGTSESRLARRYLAGLVSGRGAADLRRAGFLPAP